MVLDGIAWTNFERRPLFFCVRRWESGSFGDDSLTLVSFLVFETSADISPPVIAIPRSYHLYGRGAHLATVVLVEMTCDEVPHAGALGMTIKINQVAKKLFLVRTAVVGCRRLLKCRTVRIPCRVGIAKTIDAHA